MSRNGPGQCCGNAQNIFAFFEHHFYRHRPLDIYSLVGGFITPEPPWPGAWQSIAQQAETCQDGYLVMTSVTTYVHSVNGTRIRTQVAEFNPFTGPLDVTDNSTGDTTEYPYNEDGWPTGWDWDEDWSPIEDISTLNASTSTHFQYVLHLMLLSNTSIKLTLTLDITLSTSSSYAGFLARCEDLYEVTFSTITSDSEGAGGGNGWVGLRYSYGPGGVILPEPFDPQVDYESYFSITSTYFSGFKSIRLPDVTMYASGSMSINPRIQNPINSAGTYSLSDTGYPLTCDETWPQGQTPTESCEALTIGSTIEVGANPYHFTYIQSGACPP